MTVHADAARRRPSFFWPFVVVLVVLAVLAAAFIVQLVRADAAEQEAAARNSQVIQSISREEQVVLLSLGIQGIAERSADSQLFGQEALRIPFSERALFIQYEFAAKLGIDGADVEIEQTGEDAYRISIPEFRFIGHDDESFTVAAEDNGALSWITPEIDEVGLVNEVLNDGAKDQYVEQNRQILRDQAETFYGGILEAIDPAITAEFTFAG